MNNTTTHGKGCLRVLGLFGNSYFPTLIHTFNPSILKHKSFLDKPSLVDPFNNAFIITSMKLLKLDPSTTLSTHPKIRT
jgi:hypothetical protein